jgi:Met-10+ like-protein
MRQLLRQGIESMPAPLPVWIQGTFRYLRYPRVRARRRTHRRILGKLDSPRRVSQGPFRGMRYIALAYCSEVLPKLVGTYERELVPALEMICRSDCDRIVDVGAAEGYYAVGMALRNPRARVVAFEINPSARHYLRRLARRNGVSGRIAIRGGCTVESLDDSLAGSRRPAVICDCEGAEDRLLRPDRVEPLRRAFIVVETHDGLETSDGVLEGITRRLHERFAATHDIEVIASRARSRAELTGDCAALSDAEAAEAMDEGRPWAQWLFLEPKERRAD